MNQLKNSDIDHTLSAVLGLLSKDSTDPIVVRDIVVALLHEGLDLADIVKFIIGCKHDRENAGLPELPTMSDLRGLLQQVREPSPENKEAWADRFNSGHAQYLCPQCGYAGNSGDDFRPLDTCNVICTTCGCFKDSRYFTRRWTAEEQATFEAEQAKMRPVIAARQKREMEKRQHALDMEPKVKEVLDSLDGVGGFTNFAEEQVEVGPLVRGVVHRTTIPVSQIVAEWIQHAETHKVIAKFTPLPVHEFAARMILGEYSVKEILDNLDNFGPAELTPLAEGEERVLFTREELIHEFTVNAGQWLSMTRPFDVALGLDDRFAVTIHVEGYIPPPCDCDDCKRRTA